MKIAILGTRGVPANYGGFETFAEELGSRLVTRGHEVTVYGRRHHIAAELRRYRGMRLVVLPTIRHKYLDTVAHTWLSTVHVLLYTPDIVLFCNAANALFAAWPRLRRAKVVLNVDGIERRRNKWNAAGRGWYLLSERLATWLPVAIVTDARVIQRYYESRYGSYTTFIPYGATLDRAETTAALSRFGLKSRQYILYVSRLEPENNAHAVIAAYRQAELDLPLVMVGDAPYAEDYIAGLRRGAGPGVLFTGAIYGEGYRELQSHALAYVQATEVGGTHPALVDAMAVGNCVLANDVPEHREVAADTAIYFQAREPGTLAEALRQVLREPERAAELGRKAAKRVGALYSWDAVTDNYERLFSSLLGQELPA
jgi:glycosyltransferase involved in cell wall biosynthesis